VLSVVGTSDSRVSALQLTNGLALREADGFRYICPALWGNDNTWPMASLPGQGLVVAASSGFFLVDAPGHVTPHPDPSAQRSGVGLTLTQSQLFALEVDDTGTSIMRVPT
jgi:hypothetical protein